MEDSTIYKLAGLTGLVPPSHSKPTSSNDTSLRFVYSCISCILIDMTFERSLEILKTSAETVSKLYLLHFQHMLSLFSFTFECCSFFNHWSMYCFVNNLCCGVQ